MPRKRKSKGHREYRSEPSSDYEEGDDGRTPSGEDI